MINPTLAPLAAQLNVLLIAAGLLIFILLGDSALKVQDFAVQD